MRFYGPQVVTLPEWMVSILSRSLNALRAEEATWAVRAHRIAQLTVEDYKRETAALHEMAQPVEPVEVPTVHPDFAEWFARNGIPHRT